MKKIILFASLFCLLLSCSSEEKPHESPTTIKPDIEKEKEMKLLIDNNPFIYDYQYNIKTQQKTVKTYNIFIANDTTLRITSKTDTWYYNIKKIEESTSKKLTLLLWGEKRGHVEAQDYRLTIQPDLAKMERLSNNANWWYITKEAKPIFEKELDKSGMAFHR